ncbi:phage baseplate upper protein [Staphylococcus equorum]|uniref:phage baseplate upper protein n=1 Tax=Staphylococcus equorum TaxID=246432 RepID=UPI000853987C|nr:phage baseplate upper protein [Staphylococcus equorum]OEK62779.1 hypothetical protein ASS99_07665 [Staphylococcus equorum]
MYNKEGKIKLETSAHYVPIGKTNISFYDSDIGTADLVFYITRNQRPLEVSDENVDCDIVLVAKDGSYIVDNATIVDPLNGKAKFTIPSAFLTHTGEVKGQVFIAVHGVDDMVTEVEFTFNIQSSLVSTVPAVDKLNYIRTFDDLKQVIVERVQYIEDAIANGEDYVTQMDNTFQSGMKSLNDRSAQVTSEIEVLADNYKQELNDLKETGLTEVNDKYIESITEMNEVKTSITNITNDLVTKESLPTEIDTALKDKPYQKYAYTNEEGKRSYLGLLGSEESGYNSVLDLPPGLYECEIPSDAFTVDAPLDPNGASYIASIDVYEGNDKRKQIKLVGNYRNDIYHATVHTSNVGNPNGRFISWKRVMNAEEFEAKNTDTGWIDWNTKNGATKRETDDPTKIQNQYRVVETNGIKQIYVRANINNFESQMNVGIIPKEYVPKVQNFYIRTPVSKNPAVIYFDTDGEIWMYLSLADNVDWLPSHYAYGEVSWIIDDTGSGV